MRSLSKPVTVEEVRTRQRNVWNSVRRQENRFGTRATNSLVQIMREDSQSPELNSRIRQLREISQSVREANGVAIALSGQPLLLEYFSDEVLFERNFAALIESVVFDVFNSNDSKTDSARLRMFIEEALNTDLEFQPAAQGGARYSGQSLRLNVKAFTRGSHENELRHFLAMDLNHRSLLEV